MERGFSLERFEMDLDRDEDFDTFVELGDFLNNNKENKMENQVFATSQPVASEDTVASPKRGRGRPPGSKNKNGTKPKPVRDPNAPAAKRGRPAGSKNIVTPSL